MCMYVCEYLCICVYICVSMGVCERHMVHSALGGECDG